MKKSHDFVFPPETLPLRLQRRLCCPLGPALGRVQHVGPKQSAGRPGVADKVLRRVAAQRDVT